MSLGFRGRLFLASLALVLVAIIAAGVFLSGTLRDRNHARIEDDLARQAATARLVLESLPAMPATPEADALADALGAAAGARVTLIAEDGRVLGDSELSAAQVEAIEGHGQRPEVRAAMKGETGISRRHSTTLRSDMLYLAVAFERPDGRGVLRLARSLDDIREEIEGLYWTLAIAGLLGLVLATGIAGISARRFSGALGGLIEYTRRLSEGSGKEPFPRPRTDELGGIAGSAYSLAQQLEEQVATLARERDRFEAVLEGMNEAVLGLDREGRIALVNQAGVRLLALTGEPLGRTLLETIRVPELHELISGLEPDKATTAEFDLPTREAPRVLARAARRPSGETVLVLLDVSEVRRLESIRRDFVANVSHELRTPVSVIRVGAETLSGGAINDPGASRRFLGSMSAAAERLSRLIEDLLDISRIESGKLELEMGPVPAAAALARARSALADQAASKSIAIEIEAGEDPAVLADPRVLDQVLSNLVDNAVKYTPEGGHVRLAARRDGGRVVLEVRDDGTGIEPRHRDRLFERFYRVDPGRSRELGGTGLGLAIVKHLVTVMGGTVGMTPAPERGSIFRVELDAAEPNGDPTVDISD